MAEETAEQRLPVIVSIAAVIVVLAAAHAASALVVAVLVAAIVTVMAAPFQARLRQKGIPRLAAFAIVLVVTSLGILTVFLAVDVSLSAFIADLPAYQPGAQRLLQDTLDFGKMLHVDLTHLVHTAAAVQRAFSAADALTRTLLASIAGWAIILVLTGFMLFEALDLPAKLEVVLGRGEQLQRLSHFAGDLSRYMAINTAGAALTGIGDLVALLALGVPSALLWAGLAFLFSYIPSVGYIASVVPPTIATLLRFGFGRALAVFVALTIIDNVVGVVVLPKLVGSRVGIAPFWGLLSLLFWGWLLGPVGAILAIPLSMLAKFLLETMPSTRPLGYLMAPYGRESLLRAGHRSPGT